MQTNKFSLIEKINDLEPLVEALRLADSDAERMRALSPPLAADSGIEDFPFVEAFLQKETLSSHIVIKSLFAIGQGPLIFQQMAALPNPEEKLRDLLRDLLPVEKFYRSSGGIVGYHKIILRLLAENEGLLPLACQQPQISKPCGLDLSVRSPNVKLALKTGIEALPLMAEIYAVGGAGDRLQLKDERTEEPLPVAQMLLCGKSLLDWLVMDLQAAEHLHYKFFGAQVTTPIAMMTSHEKHNHEYVQKICEKANWFGRRRDSFQFFIQPLVPVVSQEGNWCLQEPCDLILKPGGHGVIWKLAEETGIFQWFEQQKRKKALVRQINNPIANTDIGLLAFKGWGCLQDKKFGFASCFRLLNAAEGMNVLAERKVGPQFLCSITNIEYTDFAKYGIQDTPEEKGSPYSAFPANTNILFADLEAVRQAVKQCPSPGMILNMKNSVECLDEHGGLQKAVAGRLESTMQNIADAIVDAFPKPLQEEQISELSSYVTYNKRSQTISVTKKSYQSGQPILETPEGCFYDLQQNARDLLSNHCRMEMPPIFSPEQSVARGPGLFVYFHPSVGTLYDIVAKKVRGGSLSAGSEFSIDASEVDIENLCLSGSLIISADNPLGHMREDQTIEYSERAGKCELKNIVVKNKGILWSARKMWWKGNFEREESLQIILHGCGEFYAENIVFTGNHCIEVPDGFRMEAVQVKGEDGFTLISAKIEKPSWYWEYGFTADDDIVVTKRLTYSGRA